MESSNLGFLLRRRLHGPIHQGTLHFWRAAPRLGLTGVTEIEVGTDGVVAESVAYDLNLASDLLCHCPDPDPPALSGEALAMTERKGTDGAGSRVGSYIFDNASEQANPRFRALEAIFDPGTKRFITQLRVTPGWSCLEVGTGSGSIAAWLCDRVGPSGHVLATDIDPRHLTHLSLTNLTVRRHDIRRDPLPESCFDLVHTRLVLTHLPDRVQVMQRLVAALKPGGWLLVEEFDALSLHSDPVADPAAGEFATLKAMHHVMTERGVEIRCGRLLDNWLRRLELLDVDSEGRIFMWHGGSPGADLVRANIVQLRSEVLASGLVAEAQVRHDLTQLGRDDFAFPSPILWAAWGRRP